jgi:uroporphyrinogen-III synthase
VLQPVVYRSVPARTFSGDTVEQLAMGEIDGVILLSPRTAAVYAALIRKHGLVSYVHHLPHFCLSNAIARRLEPLGGARTEIAEAPRLEEVLALIDQVAARLPR